MRGGSYPIFCSFRHRLEVDVAVFGMNSFVVISCLLVASASAGYLSAPHVTTTQYHAQDELGQYSYGYSGGPSAKEETRTADGVTRGSYSYIDANGIVQSTSYVSDPIHGFRVASTNLPQAPAAAPVVAAAPARVITAAPVVAAAPAVSHARVFAAAPAVAAVPSYVPAASAYVRAAPAYHQPAPGFDYANGVPLETPEVAAAKAAHFAAHHAAVARLSRRWKRSLVAPVAHGSSYSVVTPSGSTTVVDGPSIAGRSFSYSTVAAAPLVSAAPVVHAAPIVKSYAYAAAPVVAAAHVAPLSSSYQAQDGYGQYSYGYSDGLSSKTESRTADGVTHGGYSYLDSNGIVQSVKYVADAAGFRVHATNLPVGPTH